MQTCGCESGPRGQATKKFKFSIANNSRHSIVLNPDKGTSVRLLVAYPDGFVPVQSIDESTGNQKVRVGNPADVDIALADSVRTAYPLEVDISDVDFPIPEAFRLWALEPSANYVVTVTSDKDSVATFTTAIDSDFLRPGEKFSDDRLGHGSWVFQMPLPPEVSFLSDDFYPILPRRFLNEHYIVVAVAVFSPLTDSELIGIAPLPPPSDFTSPSQI